MNYESVKDMLRLSRQVLGDSVTSKSVQDALREEFDKEPELDDALFLVAETLKAVATRLSVHGIHITIVGKN